MEETPEDLFKLVTLDYARKKLITLHLKSGWSFETLSRKSGKGIGRLQEFEAGRLELSPHEIRLLLDAFSYFD